MNAEPLFQYERTGFRFEVWPNRIELSDTSGFGDKLTGGKQETIPARNITGVKVKGLTRKLYVSTTDGNDREFVLGKDGEAARRAIAGIIQ